MSKKPSAPPEADSSLLLRLMPLLVAALTFAVFLPALRNGFVDWDDSENILTNMRFRGLGWEQLKWMFTTFHLGHYQPLSWLTLGSDYLVWGMDAFGYHLTNVLLHSLNAAVFYVLCVELFTLASDKDALKDRTGLRLSAGFSALLFSIHPLRVESVAWVTERRDVLSGLFFLLALIFYIKPRSAGAKAASFGRLHVLPFTAFLLSLLSKAMAITMPAVLVLADIYPLGRLPTDPRRWTGREFRHLWLEKIPYLAAAAAFAAAAYAAQAEIGALVTYKKLEFFSRLPHIIFAAFFYIWKTLLPLNLAPYYKLTDGLAGWLPLAVALVLLVLAAAAAARKGRPAALAALAFYLITLSPVMNIVKAYSSPAADRYSYIPCLGFAALAGWAVRAGRRRSYPGISGAVSALACLALLWFGWLAWGQEKTWRDSEILWRHAITANPQLEMAHNKLAIILIHTGRLEEAVKECDEALRINPNHLNARANMVIALSNLGNAMTARGKLDEAVSQYRAALSYDPGYANARNGLGAVLARQGKREEARKQFQEAVRLKPDFALARKNLSLLSK